MNDTDYGVRIWPVAIPYTASCDCCDCEYEGLIHIDSEMMDDTTYEELEGWIAQRLRHMGWRLDDNVNVYCPKCAKEEVE